MKVKSEPLCFGWIAVTMPNRTENVLDLLRNQFLCRSIISIMMLLVVLFKINHHHQLLTPDYNGTGLFSYASPIRTSASFPADFLLWLCCIQSLTVYSVTFFLQPIQLRPKSSIPSLHASTVIPLGVRTHLTPRDPTLSMLKS